MAAAPPEVTRVQGGARALIGALSVSGLEGAGGVTSILREDILEEGTLSLTVTGSSADILSPGSFLPHPLSFPTLSEKPRV